MSNQQPLIGGLIAGKVLETVVGKVVERLVENKEVPITRPREAEATQKAIVKELTPYVENQANQEPWYRSRVLLGSFGAVLASTGIMIQMFFDDTPNTFDEYWVQLAVILPTMYAIYGRLTTKKPIGK